MKKIIVALSLFIGINASAQEVKEWNSSDKKPSFKVFPNPSTNGNFEISSKEKTTLFFYVFDLSGTMIYQTTLKENQKAIIRNLNKGVYVYDVFKKDEGIEHGRLIVK
ncbi:MAG: hypothetical protein C4329_08560 [Chitinophagaceae bacterium]